MLNKFPDSGIILNTRAITKYKPYNFHNFQQSLNEKLSNVEIFRSVYLKDKMTNDNAERKMK
jgi:hypothetical protein